MGIKKIILIIYLYILASLDPAIFKYNNFTIAIKINTSRLKKRRYFYIKQKLKNLILKLALLIFFKYALFVCG